MRGRVTNGQGCYGKLFHADWCSDGKSEWWNDILVGMLDNPPPYRYRVRRYRLSKHSLGARHVSAIHAWLLQFLETHSLHDYFPESHVWLGYVDVVMGMRVRDDIPNLWMLISFLTLSSSVNTYLNQNSWCAQIRVGMGIDGSRAMVCASKTVSCYSRQLNEMIIDIRMFLSLWVNIAGDSFRHLREESAPVSFDWKISTYCSVLCKHKSSAQVSFVTRMVGPKTNRSGS